MFHSILKMIQLKQVFVSVPFALVLGHTLTNLYYIRKVCKRAVEYTGYAGEVNKPVFNL